MKLYFNHYLTGPCSLGEDPEFVYGENDTKEERVERWLNYKAKCEVYDEMFIKEYFTDLFFIGPSRTIEMLNVHYEYFPEDKINFLEFIQLTLTLYPHFVPFINDERDPNDPRIPIRTDLINDWITEKRKEIKGEATGTLITKMKWNGSAASFGYLFSELVEKGWITPPQRSGKTNWAGFGKLCYLHFDLNSTIDNIIKEINPPKGQYVNNKRDQFTIPDLSSLA